jgi:hypothetical protein
MVEPPLPNQRSNNNPAEVQHRQAIQAWLDAYNDTTEEESQLSRQTYVNDITDSTNESIDIHPNPMTYGEVTLLGARQLLYYLGLGKHACQRKPQRDNQEGKSTAQDAIFVDLGMGKGKLVVQAFLEHATSLKSVIGIELDVTRYNEAVQLRQNIPRHLLRSPSPDDNEEILSTDLLLYQGDMFDLDLSHATHIYVASLCFTSDMMHRLGDKLFSANATTHHRLQTVATLQPFPDTAFRSYDRMEYVEMTWTAPWGCPVYFYDWK